MSTQASIKQQFAEFVEKVLAEHFAKEKGPITVDPAGNLVSPTEMTPARLEDTLVGLALTAINDEFQEGKEQDVNWCLMWNTLGLFKHIWPETVIRNEGKTLAE